MEPTREQVQRALELSAVSDHRAPLAVVSAMTLLCDPLAVVASYSWAMVGTGHRSVWVLAWLTERHLAYLHAQSTSSDWAYPSRDEAETVEAWVATRHAVTELAVRNVEVSDGSTGPVLRGQYALTVGDHQVVLPPADVPGGRMHDSELDEAERFVRVAARNLLG